VYILSGGINNWLDTFSIEHNIARRITGNENIPAETLKYEFSRTVGETVYPANPRERESEFLPDSKFNRKVKIERKKTISGGCG
jgi:hypothetical protein